MRLGVGNVPLQELRDNDEEEGGRTSVGDEERGRQTGQVTGTRGCG